jgi:hypothetical protein
MDQIKKGYAGGFTKYPDGEPMLIPLRCWFGKTVSGGNG